MTVNVDFRCRSCELTWETSVAQPVPVLLPCPTCGGPSRRRWSGVAVLRSPSGTAPSTGVAPVAEASACRGAPDVPGLCMLGPSAARAATAIARGDGRALEAEHARQDALRSAGLPAEPVAAGGHSHGPGPARGEPVELT